MRNTDERFVLNLIRPALEESDQLFRERECFTATQVWSVAGGLTAWSEDERRHLEQCDHCRRRFEQTCALLAEISPAAATPEPSASAAAGLEPIPAIAEPDPADSGRLTWSRLRELASAAARLPMPDDVQRLCLRVLAGKKPLSLFAWHNQVRQHPALRSIADFRDRIVAQLIEQGFVGASSAYPGAGLALGTMRGEQAAPAGPALSLPTDYQLALSPVELFVRTCPALLDKLPTDPQARRELVEYARESGLPPDVVRELETWIAQEFPDNPAETNHGLQP